MSVLSAFVHAMSVGSNKAFGAMVALGYQVLWERRGRWDSAATYMTPTAHYAMLALGSHLAVL